jgi:hypothetical protein
MKFLVTITQTEIRSWELEADSEDAAIEQAQAWNEEQSGSTPEGCARYDYSFESSTDAQLAGD